MLTFSKKNSDVADILEEISKGGIKKTDYVCEAVRFYYHNKNKLQTVSLFDDAALDIKVKKLVYKYLHEFQGEGKKCKTGSADTFDFSGISAEDLKDD